VSPRRRRHRRPTRPTCKDCNAEVRFFRDENNRWRMVNAKPVDGRTHQGPPAYPVEGRRAWKLPALVEDLQVRRETTVEEAEHEAYDMPWHVPHDCPNTPFKPQEARV
jgi:hypothetical protein